jgi:hypothetical protein
MKSYKNLTETQRKSLQRFPVYTALLAARGHKLDDKERVAAIQFAHTKVYTCNPLLTDFCRDSDSEFEANLIQIESALPEESKIRDAIIRKELQILENLLLKLGHEYGHVMHLSNKTFTDHIQKADHSVFEDFILPIAIPGLNA